MARLYCLLVFGVVTIASVISLSLAIGLNAFWGIPFPSSTQYESTVSSTIHEEDGYSTVSTLITNHIQSTEDRTSEQDSTETKEGDTSNERTNSFGVTYDPVTLPGVLDEQNPLISLSIDEIGVHRLLGVHDLNVNLCDHPIAIDFIDLKNVTYALCVSAETWEEPARIALGEVTSKGWNKKYAPLNLSSPKDVASFVLDGKLFFIVADQSKAEGSELMEYDPIKDEIRSMKPKVNSRYATAIAVWKMLSDNSYYLAISSSPGKDESVSFQSSTFIYNWTKTYFDPVSDITTYDVKDLEPFRIGSHWYLAVANYRDVDNRYIVDSEIFKFDFDSRKFYRFQKIRTYAAMDWEFFSFGSDPEKEYFLAVANQLDHDKNNDFVAKSSVYKFVNGRFSLFQCLETVRASHIASLQGDNGEFLLAVSNEYDALNLYQYDGWHFAPSEVQYTKDIANAGIVHLATHYIIDGKKHAALAIANSIEGSSIFELEFEHENKMKEWYKSSIEWCDKMREIASIYDTEKMAEHFKDFYFVDQEEAIEINHTMTLEGDVYANTLITSRIVEASGDEYEYKLRKNIGDRLANISSYIHYIEDLLKKAFSTDSHEEQIITGEYTFDELEFKCSESDYCSVKAIEAEILNGYNVRNLSTEVVFIDEDQAITSLEVSQMKTKDINIRGRIDGLHTSELVTLTGDHIVTATKSFQTFDAQDISVAGTVDGVNIHQDNILLAKGNQTITGVLTFESVRTGELVVDGFLGGVNMTKFYEEVVLKDGNYVISGNKRFTVIEVNNFSVTKHTLLNDVNLEELWDNAMWKHNNQSVSVPAVFDSVIIKKDVIAEHTINGISIPGDVILTNQDVEINSMKTFSRTSSIKELQVLNSINGIEVDRTSGMHRLGILLKTGEQTVTGSKTFKNIHLEKDTAIQGSINEVNVERFHRDLLKFRNQQINGTVTFHNVDLRNFKKDIYGSKEELNYLLQKAFKLTDKFINATFVFKGNLTIKNLDCNRINELEVPNDFVLKTSTVIYGKKTFKSLKINADATVEGLVNGFELSLLNDTLRRTGDQFISGHKTIEFDLYVNSLKINGSINGVLMEKVIVLTSPLTIRDTLTFESIVVKDNLTVQDLIVEGSLNGIDIVDLLENSLTYSGSETITGTKTISGNLIIADGGNLNTDSLNGINLSEIYKDAVSVKLHQTIRGKKIFRANVTFLNLTFEASFNGVEDWDMRHNWMRQGLPQTINGSVLFIDFVIFLREVHVGTLNGKDIVELNATIIRTNDTSIKGDLIFEEVSSFNVEIVGRVNGIDISEDLVHKNDRSVLFTARKNFLSGFEVRENIYLQGLLNDVSIEDFCEVVRKDDTFLGSLVVIGTVIFNSDLKVNEVTNGLNLTGLGSIWTNVMYTHFSVLVVEGPIYVDGLISGIHINTLNDTYLSLTRNQTVYGRLVFRNDVTLTGNLETKNIVTEGKVDGVNIDHFAFSILKTTGDQTVTSQLSFEAGIAVQDIIVHGKVNELRFPQDIVLKNKHGGILMNGTKIFASDVIVTNNLYLDVGVTVQGVDVSEWELNSVLVDGNGTDVVGIKMFLHLIVDDTWISGLLDNVNISDCPTSIRMKNVTDVRYLIGNISVQSLHLKGLINGISIEELAETTLRINENNTFVTSVNFTSPIYVTHLVVNGTINDFDLSNFDSEFSEMYESITKHDLTIHALQEVLNNQAVVLLYYEKIHVFREGKPNLIIGAKINSAYKLLVSSTFSCYNSSYVYLYDWNPSSSTLLKSNQDPLLTYGAVDIEMVSYKGKTLIVIANGNKYFNKELEISKSAAQIFVWNNESENFSSFNEIPMNPSTDIESFIIKDTICLVFCQVSKTRNVVAVYCASNLEKQFGLVQVINDGSPRKVSVTSYGSTTYLAVANTYLDNENECSLDVYVWNRTEFVRYQVLPSQNSAAAMFISHTTWEENNLFLAVGSNRISGTEYVPPLTIYRYDQSLEYFVLYQRFDVSSIIVLDNLVLESNNDLYLFALTDSESGNLIVYRHQGASKFTLEHTLTFKGGNSLHAFQDSDHHFLTLSKVPKEETCPPTLNTKDVTGILLKSKMKGKRVSD